MSEEPREQIDVNPPDGTPSWLELHVPDPDRARDFYAAMFGWTFGGDLCLLEDLPVAAIRPLGAEPGGPDVPEWTVYFAADDCDRTAERVGAAGGRITRPPHDVGDQGRAALVTDPLGARFGLWQGRAHVGTRLVNGYGTFIFNELPTLDRDRALTFYQEVFGYQPSRNSNDGDLIRPDRHIVASVVLPDDDEDEDDDLPEEKAVSSPTEWDPVAWRTYFAVESADDAVERLLAAGGRVRPGHPQDYPWGRIAAVIDPLGTPLRLVEPWDVI